MFRLTWDAKAPGFWDLLKSPLFDGAELGMSNGHVVTSEARTAEKLAAAAKRLPGAKWSAFMVHRLDAYGSAADLKRAREQSFAAVAKQVGGSVPRPRL